MWSSTLPTGTVRNEGRGSRTFPESTPQPLYPTRPSPPTQSTQPSQPNQPGSPTQSTQPSRPSSHTSGHQSQQIEELRAEVDRLQREKQQAEAEVDRLQSRADQLRKQLSTRRESQQAIIDRYEEVISDLEAAATTGRQPTETTDEGGFRSRLRRWLFK